MVRRKKKVKISVAPAGIPTNTAKAAGYSVRMEASVPLVTQAPPIQPIQIRPGVITQVRGVARMGVMAIMLRGHRLKTLFLPALQQAWSNRAQQILVPTWQQVTSVPPPPTTLASDTVAGSQRLGDWG